MIEFQNVTATYSKDIGIFDISFKIDSGELVFLMGPTGAGKSTVLRAIYKDLMIDSGVIILDDEDISNASNYKVPLIRRKIGMIFQDFKLLHNRTVFDNVSLPLYIVGESYQEIHRKVKEVLNKVGLSGSQKFIPSELSGGEQQRVGIARALVNNPQIILADEPTGNLDPNISDEILDILETYNKNGTAVLMSTHNFPLIQPRKKRFIEISEGKIID